MASAVNPRSFCPYAILGLTPGASVDDVKIAFRRTALRTHPDKIGGSCEAFNAVQLAYEALLGQRSPDFVSDILQAHSTCEASSASRSSPSATAEAAGGAFGQGSAFDPWSASTFDPWSQSPAQTFDPWNLVGSCDVDSGGLGEVGATAVAAAAGVQKKRKVKRKRRESKMALARQSAMRREGKVWPSDDCRGITRHGVYGFRPSSSEESFETDASEGVMPESACWSPVNMSAPPAACDPRRARPHRRHCERQFYCSVHNRMRFESALHDDGQGNAVCKPGMECP